MQSIGQWQNSKELLLHLKRKHHIFSPLASHISDTTIPIVSGYDVMMTLWALQQLCNIVQFCRKEFIIICMSWVDITYIQKFNLKTFKIQLNLTQQRTEHRLTCYRVNNHFRQNVNKRCFNLNLLLILNLVGSQLCILYQYQDKIKRF